MIKKEAVYLDIPEFLASDFICFETYKKNILKLLIYKVKILDKYNIFEF